jgi:hypothetical protein
MSFPTAIVVDRHEGQFQAIRQVFPSSRVIFCAKHLGAKIRDIFPKGPMCGEFWRLIKLRITLEDWQTFLNTEAMKRLTPKQERLLQWLLSHLKHYAPKLTFQRTGEQVSSRVEGFFGNLKSRIQHRQMSLPDLAKAIIDLAEEAMRKRLEPRVKPFCGEEILSIPDQMPLGVRASKLLCEEIKKLNNPPPPIPLDDSVIHAHQCCPVAQRWKIPCVHLLLLRANQKPRLFLSDFPPDVYMTPPMILPSMTSHTISHDGPDRSSIDPNWTPRKCTQCPRNGENRACSPSLGLTS